MKTYKVIGQMSGSSMDGVDLSYCEFTNNGEAWEFKIKYSETIPYDEKWRVRLSQLRKQPTLIYVKTDVYYGHYLGLLINDFIKKHQLNPDFIATHGHTVFHYPEERITAQVGDGATISAITGLPVINDFRRADMAKGGQGAPLVTIGDEKLFGKFDYCINLGGFANISGNDLSGKRVAFDICPCNIPLNRIARDLGQKFDKDGKIAETGKINYDLLNILNNLEYYSKTAPKSLNRDWINQDFWPEVRDYENIEHNERMKTIVDHIAYQIAKSIDTLTGNNGLNKKVLLTGGSAYNGVLVDHIKTHSEADFEIPDTQIIDYKEALIFAFLGVLRIQNKTNINSQTTGANADSISGGLHGDFSKIITQ
jgi:anhydro-N-acetylmuramic acid kinase